MEQGMNYQNRAVARTLRAQDALITLKQALALGMTRRQIHGYTEKVIWEGIHREVYRATAAPRTDRQPLRAACLAVGDAAVASHLSAAWLWGMVNHAPALPEITVATDWAPRLQAVRVHRSLDLHSARKRTRAGIPTTDPLRTLVDLGAVLAVPDLTKVVDRSLAMRLVTIRALVSEMERVSCRGRPGPKRLRQVIAARGVIGAPHPSVLESLMQRVFVDYDLPVPAVEVTLGPNGEYRLDFAYVAIKLAMEVDGYVWHFTPEQVRRDHARRNRLLADGWRILVFTWLDVTQRPDEVARQIRAARGNLGAP
jgi:hypothetical protein